jgi:hypothetical protein
LRQPLFYNRRQIGGNAQPIGNAVGDGFPVPVILEQNHIAAGNYHYFPSENPKMLRIFEGTGFPSPTVHRGLNARQTPICGTFPLFSGILGLLGYMTEMVVWDGGFRNRFTYAFGKMHKQVS